MGMTPVIDIFYVLRTYKFCIVSGQWSFMLLRIWFWFV